MPSPYPDSEACPGLNAMAALHALAAVAPLPMILCDDTGTVQLWNAAAQHLLGWSAAEVLGRPLPAIPDTQRQTFEAAITRLLHGEERIDLEMSLCAKDSASYTVLLSGTPIRDADDMCGVALVCQDSRRTAGADRSVEARLQTIIESLPFDIWTTTADGRYEIANSTALAHWGDHRGQRPEDLDLPPEVLARWQRNALSAFGGAVVHGAVDYVHAGEQRAIEEIIAPIWQDGRIDGILGINIDITERMAAERETARLLAEVQRQRQLLEAIVAGVPGVVWEAWGQPDDAAQRIDFVSGYIETMLGYSVDEWLTTPNFWLTIVHPDDKERAAREATAIFNNGAGGVSQFRWMAKDGRVLWVRAYSTTIRDGETGCPLGMRGVTIDITAQHTLEQQKDDFVAGVTHDLKTPLASIKALAELALRRLRRETPIEPARLLRSLEQIDATATRMATLLNEMMDVTRLHMAYPLDLQLRPVDLVGLARRVVADQRGAVPACVIEIESAIPELVGEWDGFRIERVLANLLSNAVKYSPEGNIVRVIVATERDGDAEYAVLSVADRGIGIPDADLPHIFERFRRASNVRDTIQGTGIGLSGAKHIVEQHGGTIAIKSRPGEGTTVTVHLPQRGIDQ